MYIQHSRTLNRYIITTNNDLGGVLVMLLKAI